MQGTHVRLPTLRL